MELNDLNNQEKEKLLKDLGFDEILKTYPIESINFLMITGDDLDEMLFNAAWDCVENALPKQDMQKLEHLVADFLYTANEVRNDCSD